MEVASNEGNWMSNFKLCPVESNFQMQNIPAHLIYISKMIGGDQERSDVLWVKFREMGQSFSDLCTTKMLSLPHHPVTLGICSCKDRWEKGTGVNHRANTAVIKQKHKRTSWMREKGG